MRAAQEHAATGLRFRWLQGGLLRDVAAGLAGSALLAASAWVQAPMWPVPVTMQTYAVLLIGAACGPRLGALRVIEDSCHADD